MACEISVMEKLIEYSSGNNIKGYLEIVKIFSDDQERAVRDWGMPFTGSVCYI